MKPSERDKRIKELLINEFELEGLFNDTAISRINSIWRDYILELECMKPDRDYSKDNADEQSLRILVACANSCNDLRQQLKKELE